MTELFLIFPVLFILIPLIFPEKSLKYGVHLNVVLLLGLSAWSANTLIQREVPVQAEIPWFSSLGVGLNINLDHLALFFYLLVSTIGAGVFLYAFAYMEKYPYQKRFFTTLSIFVVAMLGVVSSDDLVSLFVFWEMTSLSSFMLISFFHDKKGVISSARTSLFVTGAGGLALLVAVILIAVAGMQGGQSFYQATQISSLDKSLIQHPYFVGIIICLAIAVGTKSAQFPFFFWLPHAMKGPTPVSSFLHSATMVKAGIYLMMRLAPVFGEAELWQWIFVTMGTLTFIVSTLMALSQSDIKGILAFTTINVLGILCLCFGLNTPESITAGFVYLTAHAFYKAGLFQIIGNIDFRYQVRDITKLHNLRKDMPFSFWATIFAIFSMIGVPPLLGFYSKEFFYLSLFRLNSGFGWLLLIAVVCKVLMGAVAINIMTKPFWKSKILDQLIPKKDLPLYMKLVPFVLTMFGVIIGVSPKLYQEVLATLAVQKITTNQEIVKLKLWHGWDSESLSILGLSILTLGLGLLFSRLHIRSIPRMKKLVASIHEFGVEKAYEASLNSIQSFATFSTDRLQSGHLTRYMAIVIVASCLVSAGAMFYLPDIQFSWREHLFSIPAIPSFLVCFPIAFSFFTVRRINKLIFLSLSGFGLILYYLMIGAYDLSMTQLMVEALSLVFILSLLGRLPKKNSKNKNNTLRYVISGMFALFYFVVLSLKVPSLDEHVSKYYIENSLGKAFGSNIVNVILVDFRAADTMGEIIVVGLASIGIFVLLGSGIRGKMHE